MKQQVHRVVPMGNIEAHQLQDLLDDYWDKGWNLIAMDDGLLVFQHRKEMEHGGLGWAGEVKSPEDD